jgi:hypothetical protein
MKQADERFFILFAYQAKSRSLPCYGIPFISARNGTYVKNKLLPCTPEKTGKNLYGIAQIFVDLVSAMPPRCSCYACFQGGNITLRGGCFRISETGCCVNSSGTTDKDFPFVFGIQVQEYGAFDESGGNCPGSVKTGLFRYGEQAFQGSVTRLSLSRTAKEAATPIPSSAPRVVPFAFSHPSST